MHLVRMLFWISIFVAPILAMYSKNKFEALKDLDKYSMNKYSLGNFGGATSVCHNKPIESGKIELTCPRGT